MIASLFRYRKNKYISFHTPCHHGRNRYLNRILRSDLDLTELEETDNLFCEEGCIKELEESMASDLGGGYFYPLVNGATSGVMAALSLFNKDDKILVDRNCHISVINAIKLNKLDPVFIDTSLNEFNIPYPPRIYDIEKKYNENPDAKGIFITNPNYYGMWADLEKILAFANKKGIISIVDEAHGSHYYYLNKRKTSVCLGADISILSFHKNLPGLTQTGGAVIGNMSLKESFKENLRNYTSTSPSYLFMMSVEATHLYMKKEGEKKLEKMYHYLKNIKEELKTCGISILTDNDPFKFVVHTKCADQKVRKIKEKYKIVPEMWDSENITYIVSIHNLKKEILLLKKAIMEFLSESECVKKSFVLPKKVLLPYKVKDYKTEEIPACRCEGRISAEEIISFPPSVPVIVSGEEINKEAVELIGRKTVKCVII